MRGADVDARWTPGDTAPLPDVEPDQEIGQADIAKAVAAWDAADPNGLAGILDAETEGEL